MVATRIGSLALVTNTLNDVAASQVKLAQLQNQISSGSKSPTFEGLNGSVEQFAQVTGQIDRAAQFANSNQLNISKLQTVDVALGKITEIADQMKNAIIGANGAVLKTSNLEQNMTDLLNSLASEMNASFNGSYLFGGTDTAHPPVPDTGINNLVLGVADDNYYAGSKQDATLRIDDRTTLTFPVRADDPAFQKIYAGAKMAIAAARNSDQELLKQAQQMMQNGQSDLIAVRSREGGTVANIQSIDDRLKQLSTYWTQLSDGVSKTDLVAASTQVSSYQAVLQASFQVYARLSQLRLADYLK